MRKDDVMHKRLRKFKAREGVVFIGIAQEKAAVPRTIRKRFGEGEGTIPWIDYTTAMASAMRCAAAGSPQRKSPLSSAFGARCTSLSGTSHLPPETTRQHAVVKLTPSA